MQHKDHPLKFICKLVYYKNLQSQRQYNLNFHKIHRIFSLALKLAIYMVFFRLLLVFFISKAGNLVIVAIANPAIFLQLKKLHSL
jgi:hypothetical protein